MALNKKRLLQRAEKKRRGWVLLDQKDRLLYEKECVYDGDFGKLDSEGEGVAFAVRRNILKHWQQSLTDLRAAGIKSPLAKSHEAWDKPEDRLGELVSSEVRANDKGKPSLFLQILFDDEKSRDIGLKGDVSIGSPDVWYDGLKRKWDWPLQHVASTNAPVIPALEGWRKIAASFSANNKSKGSNMDLDALCKQLGIKVPDGASDDVKSALITQAIAALTGDEAAEPDAGTADPNADQTNLSHDDEPVVDPLKKKAAAVAANNGGGAAPQASKVTVAFSHDDPMVGLYRDSSVDRFQTLVDQSVISPALGKHLTKTFCDSKEIAFSLNHGRKDEVKKIIELVKMVREDKPLKASGRSPGNDDETNILELSHKAGPDDLSRNMEKLAKDRGYATAK